MHHTTFQLKDVTFAITMFGCGQSDKLVFDILWYDVSMFCCIHFRDDSKIVTRVKGVGAYVHWDACVCAVVCVWCVCGVENGLVCCLYITFC